MDKNGQSSIDCFIFENMKKNNVILISGTNRPNSMTRKVADFYSSKLDDAGVHHDFLSLEDLPENLFQTDMYFGKAIEPFIELQKIRLYDVTKFIFVVPEYNGSFPGIFKAFIDACDVTNCFHNKKAALVGVAAGRAGNLRGMDHLTNILNHLKMQVLPLKIPMSSIGNIIDENGQFNNPETIKILETQIKQFEAF